MAQPPDYGSYVKREPKKFSLVRFVKMAAIVTLILALIEVGVIFFFMSSKSVSKKPLETGKITSKIDPLPPKVNSSSMEVRVAPEIADTIAVPKNIAPLSENINSGTKTDTSPKTNIPVATPTNVVTNKDTSKAQVAINRMPTKLNNTRMAGILEKLKKEKLRKKNSSNCVQIRKTSNSNVTNAFKMAEYLKDRGFIIGGRLTVTGNVHGVKVNASKDCIELTIGNF